MIQQVCTDKPCPDLPQAQGRASGYIHSVETAGTVDGPGVRYVAFLSGCPLQCRYCHNPDTRHLRDGKVMTADELCADIASYKSFLLRAKGGVTISGGEPLAQADFTRTMLSRCKAMGLHTALDTSGFLGRLADDDLLAATDLVLLDIKSGLPDTYKKVAGVDLAPTLEFARRLTALKKPIWIRFVLVPGLTDAADNIIALASLIKDLPTVERIDVLPFHKLGEYKWDRLHMPYTLTNTPAATPDDIARAKSIFSAAGLVTF